MDVTKATNNHSSKCIEDRFEAAVNVIRGLPKNGSYQPSNDMMLRFYSYYKQATLGPSTQKKPPFWDIVGRAKYDSYKSLGKMSKERAMELYVEELKKIIETMSYTDNVAEFMGSISELDGIDVDDLEAVAPEAIKKVKSQPNSPLASRESSPIRASNRILQNHNVLENDNSIMHTNRISYDNSNHIQHNDASDDEYIDTVEDDAQFVEEPAIRYSRSWNRRSNISQSEQAPLHSNETVSGSTVAKMDGIPTINQIFKLVQTLQGDLKQINSRLNLLERSLGELKNQQLRKKVLEPKYLNWLSFGNLSPKWIICMVVSPIMVLKIMQIVRRKK